MLGAPSEWVPQSEIVGEMGAAPLTFTGWGGAGWVSAGTRATGRSQIGPCIRPYVVHSKHSCTQPPTSTRPPKRVSGAARNVSGPRLRRARPPRPNAHEHRPLPPNPCWTPCARRQPTFFFRVNPMVIFCRWAQPTNQPPLVYYSYICAIYRHMHFYKSGLTRLTVWVNPLTLTLTPR